MNCNSPRGVGLIQCPRKALPGFTQCQQHVGTNKLVDALHACRTALDNVRDLETERDDFQARWQRARASVQSAALKIEALRDVITDLIDHDDHSSFCDVCNSARKALEVTIADFGSVRASMSKDLTSPFARAGIVPSEGGGAPPEPPTPERPTDAEYEAAARVVASRHREGCRCWCCAALVSPDVFGPAPEQETP